MSENIRPKAGFKAGSSNFPVTPDAGDPATPSSPGKQMVAGMIRSHNLESRSWFCADYDALGARSHCRHLRRQRIFKSVQEVSKRPKSGFSGSRVSASYADGCLAWIRTMTK
jgi:hypothetical protein